jgi:multiple sugar transport system substrate-binding protein
MKLSIATQDSHKSMSVIQEAIRQFRLDNPEVSFDIQIHSSREQLYKHISGENPPDIVEWNGPNIGLRLDSGILTDLSEEINRDGVNMEDYFPSAVKAITNQDRIGALPVMTETIGVYYNKEHFDEAGIPYPQEGWTWDEFLDTARRLTLKDKDGTVTRYGVFAGFGQLLNVEPIVWRNGGAFLSEDGVQVKGFLDQPETIEGFRKYVELFDSGLSPRRSLGRETWVDCFIHGKMSMYLDANWAIKPMQDKQKTIFGTVGLPSIKSEVKDNIFQIYGYGISKACAHREMAWQFLRKLALPGSGVDRLWTVLNMAAARTTAEASGQLQDPLFAPFYKELEHGRLSAFQWPRFRFPYRDTLLQINSGDDVEPVIRSVVQRVQTLNK